MEKLFPWLSKALLISLLHLCECFFRWQLNGISSIFENEWLIWGLHLSECCFRLLLPSFLCQPLQMLQHWWQFCLCALGAITNTNKNTNTSTGTNTSRKGDAHTRKHTPGAILGKVGNVARRRTNKWLLVISSVKNIAVAVTGAVVAVVARAHARQLEARKDEIGICLLSRALQRVLRQKLKSPANSRH